MLGPVSMTGDTGGARDHNLKGGQLISGKWRRQVLGLQAPRKWVRDVSANFLLTSKLAESSTVPYPFWFAGTSRVRVLGVSTEDTRRWM